MVILLGWLGSLALGQERPPSGAELERLVEGYLAAGQEAREETIRRLDEEVAPLRESSLRRLRADLLKIASRTGPRIALSGTSYFYDEKRKRGKYIVQGAKPGAALFIGLHGGGYGSGDAESAAGAMGGGGWMWIFPEVLEKTARGWTDFGTEEFVMELIEAAKRTVRADPDRIYITGHSMGGYGAWTLGAHHADVFAGVAAYAGAPTPVHSATSGSEIIAITDGVLPSLFNVRLFFYQSLDDPRVPPGPNRFANQELQTWRARHPEGFEFRYEEVDGRGHAAPEEGYLPSLRWVASREREARPRKILWQPVLDWKRHFYWLYWRKPVKETILQAEAREGNRIEVTTIQGDRKLQGLSVLLGEPLVDLSKEVTVVVNGEERFRGNVPRTFSTLVLTIPRSDPGLLFDARVDL